MKKAICLLALLAGMYTENARAQCTLAITAMNNSPVCVGDTLSFMSSITGGTPPYTFQWTGPNMTYNVTQNFTWPNITTAFAGGYTLVVTDANGCMDTSYTTAVINQAPTIAGSWMNPTTNLSSDGSITLSGLAANTTYTVVYTKNGVAMAPVSITSNTQGSLTLSGLTQGTYTNVAVTMQNCVSNALGPIVLTAGTILTDSVWPGDVNYDLVADNNDVLDLALAYGQTGAVRTGANISWTGQYCIDWGLLQVGGTEMKHADCSGDGLVDINDTAAISQNYGQVHLKGLHTPQAKSAAEPDLYFDLTGISFTAGTTVSVPIKLGTMSLPMNNIMGIAANVKVDGVTLAVAPTISATTSWMGNSLNTMNFTKGVSNNQTDWTLTRIDHSNASGNGTIATLTMQIPTGFDGQDVVLYFDDVKMIDNAGNVITNYNVVDDTATIVPVSVNKANAILQYAAVVPNPSGAQAALRLSLAKAANVEVTVTDVTGRKVWSRKQNAVAGLQSVTLPAEIASGLYNIQVRNGDGSLSEDLKWVKK